MAGKRKQNSLDPDVHSKSQFNHNNRKSRGGTGG